MGPAFSFQYLQKKKEIKKKMECSCMVKYGSGNSHDTTDGAGQATRSSSACLHCKSNFTTPIHLSIIPNHFSKSPLQVLPEEMTLVPISLSTESE